MKRLILLEICLLIMSTAFQGDNPPAGWYIQQIPVNKNIVDIYFTDTLNGWAVTGNPSLADTGFILKTTNGGLNWTINYSNATMDFAAIQFVSSQTGYTASGQFCMKTTNAGNNWFNIYSGAFEFTDLKFINKDTGWICDYEHNFGVGLQKTTNGGNSWFQQLAPSYKPQKLFFLNKDTGWVMTDDRKLYRTNNAGNNWLQLYDFGTHNILSMFFTTSDTGWVIHGVTDTYAYKTINGGLNWSILNDPVFATSDPQRIFMINSKYGYITTASKKILKSYNGVNWGMQINTPNGGFDNIYFIDSLKGWAHHLQTGNNDMVATNDGGGPVTQIANNNEQIANDYKLYQNYPNPFNPVSSIKYQLSKSSNVKLIVYNITGKEITTLVNEKKSSGTYEVTFDGNNLPSGVYFYTLFVNNIKIDTKTMVFIK